MGIMENKVETTIMENQKEKKMENEMETGIILGLYWGYMGIMENKMETTIMENQMEKNVVNEMETTIMENQMEKNMDNEMETGIILGLYWGYMGIMEKKMETTIVYWGNIGKTKWKLL